MSSIPQRLAVLLALSLLSITAQASQSEELEKSAYGTIDIAPNKKRLSVFKCASFSNFDIRANCLEKIVSECEYRLTEQDSLKCFRATFSVQQQAGEKESYEDQFTNANDENIEREQIRNIEQSSVEHSPSRLNTTTDSNKDFEKNFGLTLSRTEESEITSVVVKIERDARSLRYFWLANGHVWKEKNTVRLRLERDDEIKISKSGFGGFFLTKDGRKKRVVVTRIR